MEVSKERTLGLVGIREGLGENDHRFKLGGRKSPCEVKMKLET
jgi:hypothetical protein